MAILLQVQSGEKSFGARTLFSKASLSIEDGEHIGVIGPNGAGKTTLFKILAGLEDLDAGVVTPTQGLRLGYLKQEEELNQEELAREYIERTANRPIWELYELAFGLGLKETQLNTPITQLSGGYRMRCQLLGQLGQEPHLLLLDEPTNYLDLESLLVLEEFLIEYKQAFLLISHDREFLRRVTDHTLEIEAGEFTKFNGHIDDYFEQKQLLEEQLQARALSLDSRRKEILDFARKFGAKATKARQVQSRLKSLKKMEKIELKPLPIKAKIRIPEPVRTGKQVVHFDQVQLGYGDKVVLKNIHFQMVRGTHLAVVGENGAGKSTFLKAIAKQLEPQKGTIHHGPNVTIGYYSQHVAENLNLNFTVYESLAEVAHKDLTQQNLRDLAGQLLFSDERIDEKLQKMSGGEKARVALGRILVQRTPLLVLDEPTNHLDFHTVEALTEALKAYEGSVIIVSHDRGFISRVAEHILRIENGHAEFYPGTYQEYIWSLQKGTLSNSTVESTSISIDEELYEKVSTDTKALKKQLKIELREAQKRIQYLDNKLERLHTGLETDSARMAELSGKEAQDLMMDLAYRQKEIDELESDWMETQEKIDQMEQQIQQLS
ncbi:MAG: ATP-binding cassette domain-containing protein [Bdellovibrionales bacterium]|nr:ATP-binding cassette domain-containing protein [Bdellovibrionales bacterium]